MLNALKKEGNKTLTENGAPAFVSTQSHVLDFFALGGALRNRPENETISIFSKAFAEDQTLALKALFYFRDCRSGQGERQTFKTILKFLANTHSDKLKPLIKYIPEYGRWDDMFVLIGTPLEREMFEIIALQLEADIASDKPSLLAKWMKSENTSSEESTMIARKFMKEYGLTAKEYRRMLTHLRSEIKIVEDQMSRNKWKEIKYEFVPSKAGLNYKKAFLKHDRLRYSKYISDVLEGKSKINASVLYPYEIAEKILDGEQSDTFEALWKSLPNYVNKDENSIVVADTSGSMRGRPLAVSVSLALYFAERNKGAFGNHFITFSSKPKLQEVIGRTLYEKITNLSNADWDGNTDIEAVFNLILNTAIKHNLKQKDMPKKIYIISDMEFDACAENAGATVFNLMLNKYAKNGFELPEIVFWNVNARANSLPVTLNDKGVQLVSGCSPVIFKQVVSGLSAYDLMIEILNSKRYENIK